MSQSGQLQQQQQQQLLQKAVQDEQARMLSRMRVAELTATCHRKCLKAPDVTRLSSGEQTCFENCASRMLEAQLVVGPRMTSKLLPGWGQ